jgi:glycosyltransferase involved in cell wall biosynthesis
VGLRNLYWPYPADARSAALKPLWHAVDSANVAMARAVGRIIDAERPDVVHTHTIFGFSTRVWAAAAARRVPLVHTLHDYYLLCPKATMYRDGGNCARQHLDCRLYSLPRLRDARHLDAVVSVSRFVLERHLAAGAFADTRERRVIHNMIRPVAAAPRGERTAGPLRIGFLGRLDPTKGIELLLDSVRAMPPGGWELRVAGGGSPTYEQTLREHAHGTAVRLVGFVDPHAFLRDLDVLVVPSLYHEPLGMVVVEAFAHGVPVVGSRRGGIQELIDEGRTGLLFDPDTPGALRAVLERLVAEPSLLDAMHAACVARARDFGPSSIVAEHVALYAAVAGRAARAAVR